jgi:ABC-2 type transport system permease protein
MVVKELHQIRRDPRALGILLAFPTVLLLFLGYVISLDVRNVSVVVLDEDRTDLSRRLVRHVTRYEHFRLAGTVDSPRAMERSLRHGEARIGLHIPRRFARDVRGGGEPAVQVVVDGTNALIATNARGTLRAYVHAFSAQVAAEHSRVVRLPARPALPSPPAPDDGGRSASTPPEPAPPPPAAGPAAAGMVVPRVRMYYNPELRSSFFLIPGLVAFILAVANALATALSIVREKERGTIEQIALSPLRAWTFLIGKTIPYVGISLASTVLILASGHLLFDVPLRGDMAFLFVSTLVYILATLGLGLLISSITSSQQVAFTVSAIATMLPTFILSGFVFPIRNMPLVIQVFTYAVPARYYIRILRSTLLMGADWDVMIGELAGMSIVASLLMLVAIVRIHRGGLSA